MTNTQKMEWALKVGVAGEFLGHGVLAIQGKKDWISWIDRMLHTGSETAATMLMIVGIMDVAVALIVLVKPINWVLLWAVFWGFWTALVRPLMGMPIWDFIERFANFGAPLALYYFYKINRR
jgi:hypothetical protein